MSEVWREREQRADRRIARIITMIANVNRDKKVKRSPYTEDDFIPKTREEQTKATMDKMLNMVNLAPNAFEKAEK